MTPTEQDRFRRLERALDALLQATGQKSIRTAVQHYGARHEKTVLMAARRDAACVLGKQHLYNW